MAKDIKARVTIEFPLKSLSSKFTKALEKSIYEESEMAAKKLEAFVRTTQLSTFPTRGGGSLGKSLDIMDTERPRWKGNLIFNVYGIHFSSPLWKYHLRSPFTSMNLLTTIRPKPGGRALKIPLPAARGLGVLASAAPLKKVKVSGTVPRLKEPKGWRSSGVKYIKHVGRAPILAMELPGGKLLPLFVLTGGAQFRKRLDYPKMEMYVKDVLNPEIKNNIQKTLGVAL